MEDDQVTDLKMALNNLVWTYGPKDMTLGVAEDIACDALVMIRNGTDAEQSVKNRAVDA